MYGRWMQGTVLREKAGESGEGGGGAGAGSGSGGEGGGPPAFDPKKYVSAEDFGKTAGRLRGLENTLKELGTKALTRDALLEVFTEIGLGEKADDGKFTIKLQHGSGNGGGSSNGGGNNGTPVPDPKVVALEREVARLTKIAQDRENEAKAERDKAAAQALKTAVVASMTKANAHKPERDAVHIVPQVKLTADGKYVVPSKDKYGNDEELALDEFVGRYLDENPELKRAAQQGGSGTPSGTPSGQTGAKVIPYSQANDMEFYAKNRDKFRSGEYVMGPKQ